MKEDQPKREEEEKKKRSQSAMTSKNGKSGTIEFAQAAAVQLHTGRATVRPSPGGAMGEGARTEGLALRDHRHLEAGGVRVLRGVRGRAHGHGEEVPALRVPGSTVLQR